MLKINKIVIVQTAYSPDKIYLHLDIPEGTWPYENHATANIDVASGKGPEYVATHLPGIEVEVLSYV